MGNSWTSALKGGWSLYGMLPLKLLSVRLGRVAAESKPAASLSQLTFTPSEQRQ